MGLGNGIGDGKEMENNLIWKAKDFRMRSLFEG